MKCEICSVVIRRITKAIWNGYMFYGKGIRIHVPFHTFGISGTVPLTATVRASIIHSAKIDIIRRKLGKPVGFINNVFV